MAKLTDTDKKNIIAAYATGTWTVRKLAAKYDVGKTTISQVITSFLTKASDPVKNGTSRHAPLCRGGKALHNHTQALR